MEVVVRVRLSTPLPAILEMPKSRTLIIGVPSGRRVRKRFAGLRSRWMMP